MNPRSRSTLRRICATATPALTVSLPAAASAVAAPAQLGPDNVARALAGGALLPAAIGVGITFVRRGA